MGEASSGSIKEGVLCSCSRRVLNLIRCDGSCDCHAAVLKRLYNWLDQAAEFPEISCSSRCHSSSCQQSLPFYYPLGVPSRENWGLGWRSDILGSRPSAAGRSGD